MTTNDITTTPLVYNGEVIRERPDMLCLTDMWKSAGSPSGRAPNDWRSLASTVEFSDHVSDILNAGKSGNDLFKVSRGGTSPGTFAHWQIGLAYAKYLSPEFHMWCNSVVRERMEGKSVSTANLPAGVLDMIERTNGISKMLAHKVTEMEKTLPALLEQALEARIANDPRIAVVGYVSVRELLDTEWKVPPKGRRSIQRKVFLRLSAYCLSNGIKAFRCRHSGTWVFPPHEAADFIREHCAALIRDHMGRGSAQKVLRLVLPRPANSVVS